MDSLSHSYTLLSTWDPLVATLITTELGVTMSSLTTEELKYITEATITSESPEGAISYPIDGSVNPPTHMCVLLSLPANYILMKAVRWLFNTAHRIGSYFQSSESCCS